MTAAATTTTPGVIPPRPRSPRAARRASADPDAMIVSPAARRRSSAGFAA